MGVPPRRINEIVLGKRGITADTAVRLARALGNSEQFWIGLQSDFDLEEAHRSIGKAIHRIARLTLSAGESVASLGKGRHGRYMRPV